MKRASLLFLTLTLLAALVRPAQPDDKAKGDPVDAFAKLEAGLTPDQVRERVGRPPRISRQILYHRFLEQWIYDAPVRARLTFDCPRGRESQLLLPIQLPLSNGANERKNKDR